MTIIEKIHENASKNPSRLAYVTEVFDENGNSKRFELTWKQLDDYSDKLAYRIEKECNSKKPVIVYGHKDPYMLVCFLACVKSGRAYCPIDISVPDIRVNSIIDSVQPDLILAVESYNYSNYKILEKTTILEWIESENNVIDKAHYVKENDVFYIIFTSGSTGSPKGVQITRDCLDNFIKWALTLGKPYRENQVYTFINQAPFSFDLSVMDVYLSLYLGGRIWALQKTVQSKLDYLFTTLKHSNANVWVSTPSFADVCLVDSKFNMSLLPELSNFLFCGETLTNKTAENLIERFPCSEVVNTYGPTESTCAITGLTITKEVLEKYNPLPVGYEKPGTFITIEDEEKKLLSEGEEGEILITGDSVSVGYFQRPELNEKAFEKRVVNGKEYRAYHTGDKGYKKDNLLFYCGRLDFQVKLHGYRIEIEDVESNLMKVENVNKVAVVPVYKESKVNSLTTFVVYLNRPDNVSDFDLGLKIKSDMKKFVPDYMIPKKIKFIDSLPMTNNGKVDRKSLKELI